MNTNIKVVLNDQERSHIKNLIDGKASSKMATRGDISDLVSVFIKQLIESRSRDIKEISKEVINNWDGYKFYNKGQEISYDKWLDIPCNDCGCLVSVAEAIALKEV
tara:strand:+ start:110 stop:427 length:318 start_codon:yes stop_codon:yes gene_type:complete